MSSAKRKYPARTPLPPDEHDDAGKRRTCSQCGTIYHHGHLWRGKAFCYHCMQTKLQEWNRLVREEGDTPTGTT